MGAYFIGIAFHFTHNGMESAVITEPFQIDI
jgi:hypothetical protein